jgi:hypothetical protein
MKLIIISLLFIYSHSSEQLVISPVQCYLTCNVCQNTLYFLKAQNQYNCNMSDCPDICNHLTSQYSLDIPVMTFYKTNRIDTCETCIQLGLCVVQQRKALDAPNGPQLTNPLPATTGQIAANADDSSYNVFKVLKVIGNMDTMTDNLDGLERLFNFSHNLSHVYIELYKKILGKDYEEQDAKSDKLQGVKGNYKKKIKKLLQDVKVNLLKNKLTLYENNAKDLRYIRGIKGHTYGLMKNLLNVADRMLKGILHNISNIKKIKSSLLKADADVSLNTTIDNSNQVHGEYMMTFNNSIADSHNDNLSLNASGVIPIEHTNYIPDKQPVSVEENTHLANPTEQVVVQHEAQLKPTNCLDDELFKRLESKIEALNMKLEKITQDNHQFDQNQSLRNMTIPNSIESSESNITQTEINSHKNYPREASQVEQPKNKESSEVEDSLIDSKGSIFPLLFIEESVNILQIELDNL